MTVETGRHPGSGGWVGREVNKQMIQIVVRGKQHQLRSDGHFTGPGIGDFSHVSVFPVSFFTDPMALTLSVNSIPVANQFDTVLVKWTASRQDKRKCVVCVCGHTLVDILLLISAQISAFLLSRTHSRVVFNQFYCEVTKMDVTLSSVAHQSV